MRAKQKKSVKKSPQKIQQFFTDIEKDEMLFAALIRSPIAHGKITNIALPHLPEGYFVFTAKDIPGVNELRALDTRIKIFAENTVDWKGEAVGIIAGPDENVVYDLTSQVEITFDNSTLFSALENFSHDENVLLETKTQTTNNTELLEIAKALSLDNFTNANATENQTNANEIFLKTQTTRDETLLASREIKTGFFKTADEKSIAQFFSNAEFSYKGNYREKKLLANWHEASGAVCFYENETLNCLAPITWISWTKKELAKVLSLDESHITVQASNTSGHAGNSGWKNTMLVLQTALVSHLLKKPVRLLLSQDEQAETMIANPVADFSIQSAFKKDGTISALSIFIHVDAGFYNPFAKEIADRLSIAAASIYNIEHISIQTKVFSSHNEPTSVFPALIDSQAFFALEKHISEIARYLEIAPDEIRKKNILRSTDKKNFTMPFSFYLENAHRVLETVSKESDFKRKQLSFERRRKMQNQNLFALPIRGIGIACAFDGSGYLNNTLFSEKQKIALTLENENTCVIYAPQPQKTTAEIWKKTVASILEIPVSSISIEPNDELETSPESIYSTVGIASQLLHRSCLDIKAKKQKGAKFPISVKHGISAKTKKLWNKENFSGSPFCTNSFGACVCEVEFDRYTLAEKIKALWLSIDCGEILVLRAAENAVRLAIEEELHTLIVGKKIQCDEVYISFIQSSAPPGQIGNLIHSIVPASFFASLSQAIGHEIQSAPFTENFLIQNVGGENENSSENK